ncbi:MAG: serine/threonine-protein kinase [Vicinamibacterales bacterium]
MSAPEPGTSWARVSAIFHDATALPSGDRARFIDETCGGDEALRAEVESLLDYHAHAETFLEPATGPAPPRPETRVGPYRIVREIGAGGMGVVYLAEDTRLGRTVALKAIAPAHAADPARRALLAREARAAAALSHPGIATVYALEEFGGALYIASEFIRGETLRAELDHGPLPVSRVVATAAGVAGALAAAHDRGIVHRDLKPENVVRGPDGRVAILDFGIARLANGPVVDGEPRLGTPAYMAPEQRRGDDGDFRVDQYALGVLVWELATGHRPRARANAAPPRLADALHPPPPGLLALDAIVTRCLSEDPADRYPSTAALAAAFAALVDGDGGREPVRERASALGWWQFHQAAATVAYAALLYPVWLAEARIGPPAGRGLLLLAVVAAFGAGALRLHAWFVSRVSPGEWLSHGRATRPWLRAADVAMSAALGVAGLLAAGGDTLLSVVLLGASVVVTVTWAVVEPATARAARRGPDR